MEIEIPEYGIFIDGEYRDGIEQFLVRDPATNKELTTVAEAGKPGVTEAIDSSQEAFHTWRTTNPGEQREHLLRLEAVIRENVERLAQIETAENGRPLSTSRSVIQGAADYFGYYAGIVDKIEGETIPIPGDRLDYTVREPLGVTGHLVPWNVSLLLGARSIAPALACGNTVVAKPSPEAPLSLLEFANLATKSGLPDGVLNVVPGDGPNTGAALTHDNRIRGLVFTGSRETGEIIAKAAAENITPIGLELGGKSPNIVFPDANLGRAVKNTLKAFRNAGQVCHAGTRVFIHTEIYDHFLNQLASHAEKLTVGPARENPDIGPLITPTAQESIANYVNDAIEKGARLVTGGEIPLETGNFYAPTILDQVSDNAPISCDELFGPVLTTYEFEEEEEVIRRANDTHYGLYGIVWTEDLARAHRVAGSIEAGSVAVNEYPATFVQAPFGGYKESGIGQEKGRQAIEHYTETKNVFIRLD